MTEYDGKKTSSPSGTTRATFSTASPSSSLYSGVSRVRNDELRAPPDGPTDITPAQSCVSVARVKSLTHEGGALSTFSPETAQSHASFQGGSERQFAAKRGARQGEPRAAYPGGRTSSCANDSIGDSVPLVSTMLLTPSACSSRMHTPGTMHQ